MWCILRPAKYIWYCWLQNSTPLARILWVLWSHLELTQNLINLSRPTCIYSYSVWCISTLSSRSIILYNIHDFHNVGKYCDTNLFADDINMLGWSKFLKDINWRINLELKKVIQGLRANKLFQIQRIQR